MFCVRVGGVAGYHQWPHTGLSVCGTTDKVALGGAVCWAQQPQQEQQADLSMVSCARAVPHTHVHVLRH